MYIRDCAIRSLILLPGATLWVTGCSPDTPAGSAQAGRAPQAPQSYRLTATVPELMDGLIDPSADVLWDSVAYIASTQGVEDRQPHTAEEWQTVRNGAVTLIEAANLLSMPGRRVAAAQGFTGTSAGRGELSPAEMQQRIDSTHDSFTQLARNLQDAALKALAAIEARDAQGLMDAGGAIDEACEACHSTYWYPQQNHAGT